MTTRLPCIYCDGSGTRAEHHEPGVTELLGCPECEGTGWRTMGGTAHASDLVLRGIDCEHPPQASDEVYIVLDGRIRVFGHREDAEQYEAQRWGERGHVIAERVLDHADARRLIEQEGET